MLEEKIYSLVRERIEQMGYELVRVRRFDKTETLQVMIDTKDKDTNIGVEDCVKVSRELSVILDVEGEVSSGPKIPTLKKGRASPPQGQISPTRRTYNLEVSSPGLDRPLSQITDFKQYEGRKIRLLLKEMINGIKKCKATIVAVKDENVLFELYDAQQIETPFTNIKDANLLVSEEIFKK